MQAGQTPWRPRAQLDDVVAPFVSCVLRIDAALVGVVDQGCVVAQRDAAVAVAEAAGDCAEVDASGEQLGRGIVAQRVQVRVDAETVGEPLEPVAH